MLAAGDFLSAKYMLERYLGGGGFASVWAARNVAEEGGTGLSSAGRV